MKNPITELTGPEFLVFYAIVIAATVAFCWWRREQGDDTASLPLPPIPERVDPYKLAYLRGGTEELTRLAIVQLTTRRYLRVKTSNESWWKSEERRIVQDADHPSAARLTAPERCVFKWFGQGRRFNEVFANGELAAMMKSHTLPYEERLRAEGLLAGDESTNRAWLTRLIGMTVLVAVGGSRAIVGWLRDRPVGYLIVMGLVGLAVVGGLSEPNRLSTRGQGYLKAFQDKWAWLRSDMQSDDSVVSAAALFGIAILAGTPYAALADAFTKSQSSDAGGCGDGCDGCGGCG